jgi:hypothetical protein
MSVPPVTTTPGSVEGWFSDVCKQARRANEATTAQPPAKASPTFITALSDAYLVPRDDLYAIFWRTLGRDLCRVEPEVAEEALRGSERVVRLGTWSGAIGGRHDEWTLWWSGGVPWVATSDVADGDQTMRLIEHWRAERARAQARGQRWDPWPPSDRPPERPAPREGGRRAVLGGLRALLGGR